MPNEISTLLCIAAIGWIMLNFMSYISYRFPVFPEIIWILILGIAYGTISVELPHLHLPIVLLESKMVLYAFVPILVFASTQQMCMENFRKVLVPASIIASFGILISMVVVAIGLYFGFNIPPLPALLLGVIVSATDPLAVGALLKKNDQITTNQKLLIEGESILNDGFVITVAGILSLLLFGKSHFGVEQVEQSLFSLFSHIIGAVIVGVAFAWIAKLLLKTWKGTHYTLYINVTLALTYSSYILADYLGFSGILSVFSAALYFGLNQKSASNENKNEQAHEHIWEYFDYLANAILFFLLGASVWSYVSADTVTFTVVSLSLFLLFVARFASVFLLLPVLRIEKKKLTSLDFWLLNFAGARGAVAIALLLLLPHNFEYKHLFITIALVMILFSLILYPLATKGVLAYSARKQKT